MLGIAAVVVAAATAMISIAAARRWKNRRTVATTRRVVVAPVPSGAARELPRQHLKNPPGNLEGPEAQAPKAGNLQAPQQAPQARSV